MCVRVRTHARMCAIVCIWRSKDKPKESVHPFYHGFQGIEACHIVSEHLY